MLTMAIVMLATMIPTMSITTLSRILKEMSRIRKSTSPAPSVDAIMTSQLPSMPNCCMPKRVVADPAANITAATPRLAPAVIPKTEGPARGFLKRVCIWRPPTERAAPAKTAVMVLGNLIFRIIASQAEFSVDEPVSILKT